MVRAEILTLLNELMGAYVYVSVKDPETTARIYEMALGEYEEEMMKEINYSPEEGILPDAGDINFDIVQKIIEMDTDDENENEDDMNKYNDKSVQEQFKIWKENYLLKNQSFIFNLFYIFYVNVIECKYCHNKTYTFHLLVTSRDGSNATGFAIK